jgi:small subunit ribosomal protein S21
VEIWGQTGQPRNSTEVIPRLEGSPRGIPGLSPDLQISGEGFDFPRVGRDNRLPNFKGEGVYSLAEVRIQDGESIENALRRFKRKVQQEDIIKEVKKHSFYLKPGEKKRIKQALARKRSRKKVRRVVED